MWHKWQESVELSLQHDCNYM